MKLEMIFAFLLTLALTMAVLSVLFLPKISLAETGTVTIAVNISTTAVLTVTPTAMAWEIVSPGDNGTDKSLSIYNGGSVAFSTGISAAVDSYAKETASPIGSSNPLSYASGNFLVLKNSSDVTYYFVNRLEWNDSAMVGTVSGKGTYGASWGFFRNRSQEFLWEISRANDTQCLNGSASNTMALKIKTAQDTGLNRDLSSGTQSATFSANNTEWSTWYFTSSGPLFDYCVAIHKTCLKLMIYRWDMNTSIPACTTKTYLNSTLNPGSTLIVTANVWVPDGVAAGNTTGTTLTITAT